MLKYTTNKQGCNAKDGAFQTIWGNCWQIFDIFVAQTVTNARNLSGRQEHARQFFLKRLTGAVVCALILRAIPIVFQTYKKPYTALCVHWTRQGLKLLIQTLKRSQLVVVGYYRTPGEFFLVSANSSTILLYNTRLGRAGGKENALFLQAVSTSLPNETISAREGLFADLTINYHRKYHLWGHGGEQKEVVKSREEEALCISLSLRALSSLSPQPLTGLPKRRGAPAQPLGRMHCSQVLWKNWGTQRHKGTACAWPQSGTPLGACPSGEIKPCPFLFLL